MPKTLLVFLLWFAGLGAAAQFAKIAVPFGLVRASYPDIGAEIGWLLSLVSLIGAFLGILAGGLVGRYGAKRILVAGLFLGAAMSFWQAFLPAFGLMLASRILEGGSHLAIVVAAPTLIAQLSSEKYVGAAMALWSTFFGVSFAIVAWLVMPLLGSAGLAMLFNGHGLFLLLIAILVALAIPKRDISAASQDAQQQGVVAVHIRAYTSPFISAPGAGWLAYTLTFVSLLALLPEKLPAADAEWLVGAMPLVSIVTSLVIVSILLRFISSIAIITMGFALAALLVVANLYLASASVFGLSLFALLGLIQGASFSAVPELNKDAKNQALAYGLLAQTGNTGNLLGTPLLLAISTQFADTGMYIFVAVIYGLGICIHAILARQRKQARANIGSGR